MNTYKIEFQFHETKELSWNYQNALSACIYSKISSSNAQFAEKLHNIGFKGDNYFVVNKGFCFSPLMNLKFKNTNKKMLVSPCKPHFFVSFYQKEVEECFLTGVFISEQFTINGLFLNVINITLLEKVTLLPTMNFRLLSGTTSNSYVEKEKGFLEKVEISPTDERFKQFILTSLKYKFEIYHGFYEREIKGFDFKITSEIKSNLSWIKKTSLRTYRFDFEISLPIDLMQVLIYTGLGNQNSQGFGFVQCI